jgi:hypothetical protein
MINIDELLKIIESDKKTSSISHRRYPVRFILLNNYQDLISLIDKIPSNFNIEILQLTDLDIFKYYDDAWITVNDIIFMINELDPQKDYLILSVSEYCKFLSDDSFYSLLVSIMNIENSENNLERRIYIPLVGIKNRFEKIFFDKYPRRREIKPYWNLEGETKTNNLYFVNFIENVDLPNTLIIETSKDFLNIWKQDLNNYSNIVCTSKTLNLYSKDIISDNTFNVYKIKNYKEYLKHLLNINIPIEYKEEEKSNWEKLWELLQNKKFTNFYELTEELLNVKKIAVTNLLNLWFKHNEFHSWLLKNYIINKDEYKETYALKVLKSLESYEIKDILTKYYVLIFDDINPNNVILEERRKTLKNLLIEEKHNIEPIISEIDNLLLQKSKNLSPDKFIIYLTGTTAFEKAWIIQNYDKLENLKELYPELFYYLTKGVDITNLKLDQSWILEYFKEYRISRLKNQPTKPLLEILNEKNKDENTFFEWYSSFTKISNYKIEEGYDKFWIDALSLEFLPLIAGILEEKGYKIEAHIAVANLPTTTERNKFEGIERIDELDKFIHEKQDSNIYPKLIQEIEIIKKTIEKILLIGKEKFVILSDHGFNAFANKKFQAQKLPEFKVKESEIRYTILEKNTDLKVKEDVVQYEADDKKYVIALKYTSFSFPQSPEIHGGATPEEVLVPIIYASKQIAKERKVPYMINITNKEINIRNPILIFNITPIPETEIIIKYKGEIFEPIYSEEEKCYKINLNKLKKAGVYELTFSIGDFEEKHKITIKGGMEEKELL